MKKLTIFSILALSLATSYAQKKPFTAVLNEGDANRIYFILTQVKSIVPRSQVSFSDGLVLINQSDSMANVIKSQYDAWIANNNKQDSIEAAKKKKP
jgi:hypothetical protein